MMDECSHNRQTDNQDILWQDLIFYQDQGSDSLGTSSKLAAREFNSLVCSTTQHVPSPELLSNTQLSEHISLLECKSYSGTPSPPLPCESSTPIPAGWSTPSTPPLFVECQSNTSTPAAHWQSSTPTSPLSILSCTSTPAAQGQSSTSTSPLSVLSCTSTPATQEQSNTFTSPLPGLSSIATPATQEQSSTFISPLQNSTAAHWQSSMLSLHVAQQSDNPCGMQARETSRGRRNRRSNTKMKMYECPIPCDNPEMEKRIRDAKNSKKNRDQKNREREELKQKVKLAITRGKSLRQELATLRRREEELRNHLWVHHRHEFPKYGTDNFLTYCSTLST